MSKTRVLYVSHEMQPYFEMSIAAELGKKLPAGMQTKGIEIRALMTKYGMINERRHRLHEVVRLSGINIIIGENDHPLTIKVATLAEAKMQVYFLENEDYFKRKEAIYADNGTFFADNHERMTFFCKGVLETVAKLGWVPDIIHCNGWFSALLPVYVRKYYSNHPVFQNAKMVYSVYNNQFTSKLSQQLIANLASDGIDATDIKAFESCTNDGLDLGVAQLVDGLVIATDRLTPEIAALIAQNNIPVLQHASNVTVNADLVAQYLGFYKTVLETEAVMVT
jgi:starch synthase